MYMYVIAYTISCIIIIYNDLNYASSRIAFSNNLLLASEASFLVCLAVLLVRTAGMPYMDWTVYSGTSDKGHSE